MSCVRVVALSATYWISGRSRIASASSGTIFVELPAPVRTPCACVLPGEIVMRFVPADLTCSSIVACAPDPSATMAMTAATPMIIPSIVRAVRSLLRPSALKAIRSVMNSDIDDLVARA